MNLAYNVILGRPLFLEINMVIITKYLTIKFPIDKELAILKGSQMIFRKCTSICLKGKNTLWVNQTSFIKKKVKVRIKAIKSLKEVNLYKNVFTNIGSTLDSKKEKTLIELSHI